MHSRHLRIRRRRLDMAAKTTQQQTTAADAIAQNNQLFLRYARTQPYPVLVGSIPQGATGGTAQSLVEWTEPQVPQDAGWMRAVTFTVTLPVSLTLAAGASVTVSNYAPTCAFNFWPSLAGSPEFPNTAPLLVWACEEQRRGWARAPLGLPVQSIPAMATSVPSNSITPVGPVVANIFNVLDMGPNPTLIWNNTSNQGVLPGQTITNSGTAAETIDLLVQFSQRVTFQVRHNRTWGMLPIGDPSRRVQLNLQLNALIGTNSVQNLFVNSTSTANSASLYGAATVYAVLETANIDLLPSKNGQPLVMIGAPVVEYGLNLTTDNLVSVPSAGSIRTIAHRSAMAYLAIHHFLLNNGLPQRADYFGLWITQNSQTARWAFDATLGNFQQYFTNYNRIYGSFPLVGHYLVDLESGEFPPLPSLTPFQAAMSPDATYAAALGVEPTPNMNTAIRVPSQASLVNGQVAVYSVGLIAVPY
jgi:hypothetical protein